MSTPVTNVVPDGLTRCKTCGELRGTGLGPEPPDGTTLSPVTITCWCDGRPAFLNVLTDCPVGWGHEPRLATKILDTAVDSLFWPLYEVVEGEYRLSYGPERPLPIESWLAGQARFAHLLRPDNRELLDRIQDQVDADWAELLQRCA